jgi:hypothetical protein
MVRLDGRVQEMQISARSPTSLYGFGREGTYIKMPFDSVSSLSPSAGLHGRKVAFDPSTRLSHPPSLALSLYGVQMLGHCHSSPATSGRTVFSMNQSRKVVMPAAS